MNILTAIIFLIVLLYSLIFHEIAHGAMANYLGDPTARQAGRLSLNPLKHFDLRLSVLLPLFLFYLSHYKVILGLPRPVPCKFSNLTNQRWGATSVALAGPAANIALAIVFGLILRFTSSVSLAANFELREILTLPVLQSFSVLQMIVLVNILIAVFNLVPIPPLDGSKIFWLIPKVRMFFLRIKRKEFFGLIFAFAFIILTYKYILLVILFIYKIITGGDLLPI